MFLTIEWFLKLIIILNNYMKSIPLFGSFQNFDLKLKENGKTTNCRALPILQRKKPSLKEFKWLT